MFCRYDAADQMMLCFFPSYLITWKIRQTQYLLLNGKMHTKRRLIHSSAVCFRFIQVFRADGQKCPLCCRLQSTPETSTSPCFRRSTLLIRVSYARCSVTSRTL